MAIIKLNTDRKLSDPRSCLNDPNLSVSDRGMLMTLFSLPSDCEVSITYLMSILPDGQKKIVNSLKRLEESNYIERKRTKDGDSNLLTKIVYYVSLIQMKE